MPTNVSPKNAPRSSTSTITSQTDMAQVPTDLSKLTGQLPAVCQTAYPHMQSPHPGPLPSSSVSPAWIGAFMLLASYT